MSHLSPESLDARHQLAELGATYHRFGWLFGTSGNLSARFQTQAGQERVVVSASGRHKGYLKEEDFVELDLDGHLVAANPGDKPSAEASIHTAVYRTRPDARVCLHVHTVASTLALGDVQPALPGDVPRLRFQGLELIKGWDLWEENVVADLPVFPNHSHVPKIADEIEAFYQAFAAEKVPSLLIATHGITAWGKDFFSANRHLEVCEFLCQIAQAKRSFR